MANASFWYPERLVHLRSLLEVEKMSAAQAGAELGCSRMAVIGAARRNGINFARPPSGAGFPKQRAPRSLSTGRRGGTGNSAGTILRIKSKVVRKRMASPLVFGNVALKEETFTIREVEVSTEHQCGLLDLKNESCRYPVADESPHIFCGVPEADLTNHMPYCRAHDALCYRPHGETK